MWSAPLFLFKGRESSTSFLTKLSLAAKERGVVFYEGEVDCPAFIKKYFFFIPSRCLKFYF